VTLILSLTLILTRLTSAVNKETSSRRCAALAWIKASRFASMHLSTASFPPFPAHATHHVSLQS